VEDTIANENSGGRGFLPVKSERVPERLWTSRQEASRPSEIKGTCLTLNDQVVESPLLNCVMISTSAEASTVFAVILLEGVGDIR
jgi:hypothetical protein